MKSTNRYFTKSIYFFILVLSISFVQAKPVEDEVTLKNRAKNIAIKHLKKRHMRGIDEVKTKRVDIDRYGLRHVRVKQMHKGIPVFGGEAIVHLNEKDDLYHVTDQLKKDIAIDVTASISAKEAIKLAISYYGKLDRKAPKPQADLQVLVHEGVEYLTYRVQINDLNNIEPMLLVIFVNAITGEEIWRYNNLKHIKNRNTYDTNNSTSLPGTLIRTEGSAPSNDSELDSAHEAAGLAHDYYFNVHGRDSFNGSGAIITSTVHYKNNYVNAFWNGSQLVYGDGDGVKSDPLTVTDIVAHELTHAVTDYSSNLIYANESGALNEAMSDIFGAAIEAYRDGSVSANTWKIGEEAWTPATAGDALRYMNDPALAGDYDYYPDRYIGSQDNGGVHWNSGIANLAFYLLSEGGTHPRAKTSNTVLAIGITDAAAIYYRANTVYMTASSTFSDARIATVNAAKDIFGASSNETTAVNEAWTAVGVTAPPEYEVIDVQPNLSGNTGNIKNFVYPINGATAMQFVISGGSGDADLYVKHGSAPTTANYDCRPYLNGNNESCEFNPTAATGSYYVMIRAYSTYSGTTLTVSSEGGTTAPPVNTPPIADDQNISVNKNSTDNNIVLISNDDDGDSLIYSIESGPSNGTLDLGSLPTVLYTPNTGFFGVDSFTFSSNDGVDNSNIATVIITVNEVVSPPAPNVWVELLSSNFESGWEGFLDGGSDARRSSRDANYANSGQYCIRIRDNSGSASSFYSQNAIDLSGYSELKIEFSYFPRSMENGEDFMVELWNGSRWIIIANYTKNIDFSNNIRYNPSIIVDSVSINFSSGAKLRFRADGSSNADLIYIDDVKISAR